MNTQNIASYQVDLSLELILCILSKSGLEEIFHYVESQEVQITENCYRICLEKNRYLQTIDPVMAFLQNKNPTLALSICNGNYLPRASRFDLLEDLDWAFGHMGTHDQARHLATLYLEDIGDLITEAVDKHFGFSRYAERLCRTSTHFDEIYQALLSKESILMQKMKLILEDIIRREALI